MPGELNAVEIVKSDVLILGGGMAGCGAAYEAAYWASLKGLSVNLVEKSTLERGGAVAAGLSAINCYLGMENGENAPEDYVAYVRRDMMGVCREDLVFDIARHVDSSVHLFERWGLPICTDANGNYLREGRWQIRINGESFKPIVADAVGAALGKTGIFEHLPVFRLLLDRDDPGRVAGAIGFCLRTLRIHVFLATSVVVASGGATGIYPSRGSGESRGRTWYAPWNTGSAYKLMIEAGAEMCQLEHRVVVPRFKGGYGPVGMWFLYFGAELENAKASEMSKTSGPDTAPWNAYAEPAPLPTPLRTFQMRVDGSRGGAPHRLRTDSALQRMLASVGEDSQEKEKLMCEAWGNFLNMAPSQALLWASADLDPSQTASEIVLTEPYLVGSHAGGAGAWVSGPADVAPREHQWGYNRMTSVRGLFAAGDAVGGCGHKFSSGSFTEGRLAGKAAVAFALDCGPSSGPIQAEIDRGMRDLRQPLRTAHAGAERLHPREALCGLQQIMDEYVAGRGASYTTHHALLARGLELLGSMRADLRYLAANTPHQLLRCHEVGERLACAEAHARHILFRQETRWPGYYCRADFPALDDLNWRCFVTSTFDCHRGHWELFKRPCHTLIADRPN